MFRRTHLRSDEDRLLLGDTGRWEKPSDERIKNDIATAIGLSAARTRVLLKEMSDVEYEGITIENTA